MVVSISTFERNFKVAFGGRCGILYACIAASGDFLDYMYGYKSCIQKYLFPATVLHIAFKCQEKF